MEAMIAPAISISTFPCVTDSGGEKGEETGARRENAAQISPHRREPRDWLDQPQHCSGFGQHTRLDVG